MGPEFAKLKAMDSWVCQTQGNIWLGLNPIAYHLLATHCYAIISVLTISVERSVFLSPNSRWVWGTWFASCLYNSRLKPFFLTKLTRSCHEPWIPVLGIRSKYQGFLYNPWIYTLSAPPRENKGLRDSLGAHGNPTHAPLINESVLIKVFLSQIVMPKMWNMKTYPTLAILFAQKQIANFPF
jgi:hypothetical protein